MNNKGKTLTKFQYSIWKGQKLHPDTPLYNMAFTFDIYGQIDPKIFKDSFKTLAEKTTSFRLVIDETNENFPQQILSTTLPTLEYIDTLSIHNFNLDVWLKEKNQIKFDLQTNSIYSALLKLADEHYVWYINQHHMFTDAYAFQIMYSRMSQIYFTRIHQKNEKIQIIDDHQVFEKLIETDKSEKSKEFISYGTTSKNTFSLYGQSYPLRKDTKSHRTTSELSTELVNKIYEKLEEMNMRTLSANLDLISYLITSLLILLSQVAESSQGISISNIFSKRISKISKEIAFPLLEVLSQHIEFSNEETVKSLHQKVYSFLIMRDTKSSNLAPSLSPLIINFFSLNFENFNGFKTECKWHHSDHIDDHHYIRLHVLKYKTLQNPVIAFDVKSIVSDESLGLRLIEDFLLMVKKLCTTDFLTPINSICIVPDNEIKLLKEKANATDQFHIKPSDYISNIIKNNLKLAPNAIAIYDKTEAITYHDLKINVLQFASNLKTQGVTENSKVVINLPRSKEYIYAILGTLFCKAIFVPVPISHPIERLKYILRDVDADILITSEIKEGIGVKTIHIDKCLVKTAHTSIDDTREVGDNFYILYTSGSTGKPKGVSISQASFTNYIKNAADKYLREEAYHMPFFTSIGFDLTMTSIFLPLFTGGAIHVYGEHSGLNLEIQEVIKNQNINCLKCTPSHLMLLEEVQISHPIKTLIIGGEKLETQLAKKFIKRYANTIFNEYGPTEATVGCIVYKFNENAYQDSIEVPIGLVLDNYFAFIANDSGTPLPNGVIGELCIGGAGLADGYINNEELTAEYFISQNNFIDARYYKTGDYARVNKNGVFEFYGRKDNQIKLGGIRIETGEIAHYLNSINEIGSCIVTGDKSYKQTDITYTYCSQCGLPSNYPTADMDDKNVCTYCRSFEGYKNKVAQYFKSEEEFQDLFVHAKNPESTHDCIMLYSGGKDSTYALGKLNQMGLKVLAFTLDNGYISDMAKENINRIVSALGVDHVYGSSPAMNEIFVDSLKTHCNVCNGCYKTIYNLSLKIAFENKIPFIVTGLSRGQFFETKLSEEIFWKPMNDVSEIEETLFAARKAYHDVPDIAYQKAGGKFIKEHDVLSHVKILDFYRYHDVSLKNLLEYINNELPWVRPDDTGRSTNCLINKVGIYIHKKKKGYSNYAFPYSWDVRTGHKTKEETIDEIEEFIDEKEVKQIIKEIGYKEEKTNNQLIVYYTGQKMDNDVLNKHLLTYLPEYMIPFRYIHVDHIPLTNNGKVDMVALQETERNIEKHIIEPANEIEEIVHSIWKEVLDETILSTDDDFFDLGGTSIDAIRIVARIEKTINYKLEINHIFKYTNIKDLSNHIMQEMLSIIESSK